MTGKPSNDLSVQLEKDRGEIADLQLRVQKLVARRANKVPEKKKEAEELQRGVETLAHATSGMDTTKPKERDEKSPKGAKTRKLRTH